MLNQQEYANSSHTACTCAYQTQDRDQRNANDPMSTRLNTVSTAAGPDYKSLNYQATDHVQVMPAKLMFKQSGYTNR